MCQKTLLLLCLPFGEAYGSLIVIPKSLLSPEVVLEWWNNMLRRKKILMVSCQHWKSPIQVGDHLLARQFLDAGWQVGFVSDPVTPFHLVNGFELKPRLKNYLSGGVREKDGDLWGYVPGGLVMPYNLPCLKSRWVHSFWQNLTFPNLVQQVRKNGFDEVDVLYFRTAKQAFWLDRIKSDVSVFRVADSDSGFFDYNDEVCRREQALVQRADLTVYTSKPLEDYVTRLNPRDTLYLPNGVEFDFFSRPMIKPTEYREFSGPIAVHVGSALPERFDFELVDLLTKKFSEVQFVFVGPDAELRRRLHQRPNLHLLGPRPYGVTPGYMQHADVGLILLDADKNPVLVNSTNPLKLYQYLASGLTVVSMQWDALKNLAPPAFLAKNRDEFIRYTEDVLSGNCFDPEELMLYAKNFDWKIQFDNFCNRIENISENKLLSRAVDK